MVMIRTSYNPKSPREVAEFVEAIGKLAATGPMGADKATREIQKLAKTPQGKTLLKEAIKHASIGSSARSKMESSFATGFSDVKASAGSSAGSLGAAAFATGSDVSFGRSNGEAKLIAHELAHVVQQRGS